MSADAPSQPCARRLAYVYHPRSFPTMSLVEAARGLCELLWIVDTSNEETGAMVRLLKRFGLTVDIAGLTVDEAAAVVAQYEPHGILTLADANLTLTAGLASRIDRPFASPTTAERFTDKHAQRDALAAADLAVPRHWIINDAEFDESWRTIELEATFPAVLKPRRGEGSRDTLPVASLDELRTLVDQHRSEDPSRDFVLEEYIADTADGAAGEGFANYVSVESFVRHGEVVHLAITGRMPPAFPFRETGFFMPSALSPHDASAVLDLATRAARALGVTLGCLHTEIKLTPDGPVVIEVNGRIGGGVPEMLMAATDVDFIAIAMRLALEEVIEVGPLPLAQLVAYLFYVQAPVGLHNVTSVEGLDELREFPGVRDIILNRGPGQLVDWREGNHGHVFSVFGTAVDLGGVHDVEHAIRSITRIVGG